MCGAGWLVRSAGWALGLVGLLSFLSCVYMSLVLVYCSRVRVFIMCVRVFLGVFGRSAALAGIVTLSAISTRVAGRMPLRSLSRSRPTNV